MKKPTTDSIGKVVGKTRYGKVHDVTTYKPTQKQIQKSTQIVNDIAHETGQSYINKQKKLPDIIPIGATPTTPRHCQPEAGIERGHRHDRSRRGAWLRAQRDRLVEKFTVMQADLGGAFYEMAIRDHVRMDVLTRNPAELQRVDAELLAIERILRIERSGAAGICRNCGAPYAHGVLYCSQCGTSLAGGQAAP